MKNTVLVVDDDPIVQRFVGRVLTEKGYSVVPATTAEEGLKMVRSALPDLIILDLGLNGVSGKDILGAIKNDKNIAKTPIIVLTGSDDSRDSVSCLNGGADDYLVKTFDTDIFVARVKAVLRRANFNGQNEGIMRCGDLSLDNESRVVFIKDRMLESFTSKEFDLLFLLAQNSPKILSRNFLIRKLWPERGVLEDNRTVDVHIRRIRLKIDDKLQTRLVTVTGKGYKLLPENNPA